MRRRAAGHMPVDSRWHAIAYAVRSREELPEDFDADAAPEFRTAVFLPRDENCPTQDDPETGIDSNRR